MNQCCWNHTHIACSQVSSKQTYAFSHTICAYHYYLTKLQTCVYTEVTCIRCACMLKQFDVAFGWITCHAFPHDVFTTQASMRCNNQAQHLLVPAPGVSLAMARWGAIIQGQSAPVACPHSTFRASVTCCISQPHHRSYMSEPPPFNIAANMQCTFLHAVHDAPAPSHR